MGWLLFHFFIVDFCPTRRFRNMRRYSLVNQHEDTDALLDDDEDEPPLDLRSDSRDEGRSRDDAMLDLGTGRSLWELHLWELCHWERVMPLQNLKCLLWNECLADSECEVCQLLSWACSSEGKKTTVQGGLIIIVLWVTNLHLLWLALHEGESCGA